MSPLWVVTASFVALLIAAVRIFVWYQRWDPLDWLKEAADPGQFGSHRSMNRLLAVDPAINNRQQGPSGTGIQVPLPPERGTERLRHCAASALEESTVSTR